MSKAEVNHLNWLMMHEMDCQHYVPALDNETSKLDRCRTLTFRWYSERLQLLQEVQVDRNSFENAKGSIFLDVFCILIRFSFYLLLVLDVFSNA